MLRALRIHRIPKFPREPGIEQLDEELLLVPPLLGPVEKAACTAFRQITSA